MKDTDKFSNTSRCVLACTIAAALFSPVAVMAAAGQQVADGTQLSLEPGEYGASGEAALYMLNGGSITAGRGVVVNAAGNNGHGAWARGAFSSLVFGGGSLTTTGQGGHGVYASAGGSATIGRDPDGLGTTITTSGASAYGLFNSGSSSSISATNLSIYTSGRTAWGAYNTGGLLNLTDSSVFTTGDQAVGVYADAGGHANLVNVTVDTKGQSAHGALFDGARGKAVGRIANSSLKTSGNGAYGVNVVSGAEATLENTNIETSGALGFGVALNHAGSSLTLNKVTINTSGQEAYGLWLVSPDAKVHVEDLTLSTTGDASTGINNRSAMVDLTNASVFTAGASSYGLYASQEYGNGTSITGKNVHVRTEGANSAGAYTRLGADISLTDSSIGTTGDGAMAVRIGAKSTGSLIDTPVQTSGANAFGLYSEGVAKVKGGSVVTQGEQAHGIAIASGGQVGLDGVDVNAQGENAYAVAFGTGGGRLDVNGGTLSSSQFGAFGILGADAATSDIHLANGAQVVGGNGILMNVANPSGRVDLAMDGQTLAHGDVVFDEALIGAGETPQANVNMTLSSGSLWVGATNDAVDNLALNSGSQWMLAGSSSVGQLALNDAGIQFASPANGDYKTLLVKGDFSGSGGAVAMNTLLNEGGPLSNQHTDRLLIQGNVTTTGTTILDVTPQGNGASAPVDKNGVVDPTDGISLVQVGGTSRADAFALRYGYVAVGPYQYKLYAFGPGQADASQNVLPSGELNWDYRLAPKFVDDGGDPGNPGDPGDPGNPGEPGDGDGGGTPVDPPIKPSVPDLVAQLPSYIVAPIALMTYGDTLMDTLHQRLGDIRDTAPSDPHGGELFARYIGSQQRYASSQRAYGYDFDQQINAMQLGGSLVSVTNDASSLRVGWALDKGVTRVTPHVHDSENSSFSRYEAHGASAWMTWQQNNGFYLDAIVGGERYNGTVNTAVRGAVANIRAGGWTASLEAGYPFAIGGGWWAEPQLQVKRQSLSIDPFQDVDNITTQIQVGGVTRTRAGLRVTKSDNPSFAPYGRLDFVHTMGGNSRTTASNAAWGDLGTGTFEGGRLGNTVRVGAGASSRLTPYLSIYGEADYLHGANDYGMRGWQANVGLRFEF